MALGKNNSINLVCISDKKYLKYLRTLLKSLSLTNPEIYIHITLINIQYRDRTTASLKKIFKNIEFTYIDKKFNKAHHLKAFCANYRPRAINLLMKQGYEKILYTDVDTLFRKNLSEETDLFNDFDIKVHFRNSDDRRFKVAAGIILLNNTVGSAEFMESWSNQILEFETSWFADQITFYECYKKYNKRVKFQHLDKAFIDWDFKLASAIWAGKGDRKKKDITYLLEVIKIRIKYCFQRLYQ